MPTPSKGISIEYNTDLAALDADPDWITLGCIKRVTGAGGLRIELEEHRCLDASDDFVGRFPTGFKTSEDMVLTVSWTTAKYGAVRAIVDAVVSLPHLFRLTFTKEIVTGVLQTVASKEKWQGYFVQAMPAFPENGGEITFDITISPNSKPAFTAGA